MPYKSNAQRKYFHVMESKGEISPKIVDEFDQASKGQKLPEYIKTKKKKKSKKVKKHKSVKLHIPKENEYSYPLVDEE